MLSFQVIWDLSLNRHLSIWDVAFVLSFYACYAHPTMPCQSSGSHKYYLKKVKWYKLLQNRHCSLFISIFIYPVLQGTTSVLASYHFSLSLSLFLSFFLFLTRTIPYTSLYSDISTRQKSESFSEDLSFMMFPPSFPGTVPIVRSPNFTSHLSFGHLSAVHSLHFGRLGIQFVLGCAEQHQRLQRTQQRAWMPGKWMVETKLKIVGNP